MGISLDGLASGLDTTTLIATLMQVEARPQQLLKISQARTTTQVTDLQTLNSRLASLLEKATTAAKPAGLQHFTTTSSDASVTVTAKAGAGAASLDLVVTDVATAHSAVTAAMSSWPASPPVLTFVTPDGTAVEVTAASSSLADVARAVNETSGLGISATRVQAGTDGAGTPLYRLQFVAKDTGVASAFEAYQGTAAEVTAGTATDLLTQPGAAITRTGSDASITLWAGTAAEQTVTSASNTFTDLLPGVDVTVSKPTADPVSISLTPDLEASSNAAGAFLDEVRTLLVLIAQKSATSTGTDADGNPVTNIGSFTSDSNIRGLTQALVGAIQSPVDGASVAPFGISISKTGELEFDAEKFQAALAADPAKVEAAFATVSQRVADVADRYSDKYDGQLTRQIEGRQALIKDLDTQIESWTRRLDTREANLKRTYAALEVALSAMNAQSDYLQSQLAGLPTWNPQPSK